MSSRSATLRAIAGAALTALVLASCGEPERSTSAYCSAYNDGFAKIKQDYPQVDQYQSSGENPIALLLQTTSAYGDVVALIGDMSKVAPDEIRTDTERVYDTLQKQIDLAGSGGGNAAAGNLSGALSSLGQGLLASLTNAGAFQRMDEFVVANCGGKHMFSRG